MGYNPLLRKVNKLIKTGKTNKEIDELVRKETKLDEFLFNYFVEFQRCRLTGNPIPLEAIVKD